MGLGKGVGKLEHVLLQFNINLRNYRGEHTRNNMVTRIDDLPASVSVSTSVSMSVRVSRPPSFPPMLFMARTGHTSSEYIFRQGSRITAYEFT